MPLCNGLPDGPCPKKVNNRSVRLSQGDLMLCPSCDAVLFPPKQHSEDTGRRANATATLSTARKVITDSVKVNNELIRGPRSDDLHVDTSTTTEQKHDDDCVVCPRCQESITAATECIKCESCLNMFHRECTGLSNDVFKVLMSIISQSGWVCRQCRSELNNCKSALAKANEELADIRISLAWLYDEVKELKSNANKCPAEEFSRTVASAPSVVISGSELSQTNMSASNMQLEIHRTFQDIARRKCNVIVTGLPEPPSTSDHDSKAADVEAFTNLCEEHLSIKPSLARKGCYRLGKPGQPSSSRPRRLLVHLTSEANATNLLSAARELRRSDDENVARNVFINPDLSPVEAKIAYEQRQRRRAAAARRSTSAGSFSASAETTGQAFDWNVDVNLDPTPAESEAINNDRVQRTQRRQAGQYTDTTVGGGTTLSASAPSFVPPSNQE